MKFPVLRSVIFFLIALLAVGCANIVPPSGGKKDTIAPKLVGISPSDSQLNNRVSKIDLSFNEYVELNSPSTEVQISPLLSLPMTVTAVGKKVSIRLVDSLLQPNTTYRISTNSAIKDIHEGNPFRPYTYTFSTGPFFDSLNLDGIVYDAASGMPDTGTFILLYDARLSDSIVVQQKPSYVTKVTEGGKFSFKGLPYKRFHIYALHDANGNLVYDGKGEMIGFIDSTVAPVSEVVSSIVLRSFKEEIIDTNVLVKKDKPRFSDAGDRKSVKDTKKEVVQYSVEADTSNLNKRTVDVNKPLKVLFVKHPGTINKNKIFVTRDSGGIDIEVPFNVKTDTAKKLELLLDIPWKEEAVYSVRFLKAFAKDSLGNETLPSKYTFRTKYDEDYGVLDIRLPEKYKERKYLLLINNGEDTIYFKPVTDTMVKMRKISPANYSMRIIVDENKNGKWDTGDLFEKRQPESVIPYKEGIPMKAGWDMTIDFEPRTKPKPRMDASPEKRDKPPVK